MQVLDNDGNIPDRNAAEGGRLSAQDLGQDSSNPLVSSSHSLRFTPDLRIPNHRRHLLQTGVINHKDINGFETMAPPPPKQTVHFVIRVLKSWPRIMAMHQTDGLPPIIHKIQFEHGTPRPLANCFTLAKMWAGHADGSGDLVMHTVLKELRRLIDEVCYEATMLSPIMTSVPILCLTHLGGL